MANMTEMDSSSSPTPTPAEVVEDMFGILKVYSDGSIYRATDINHKNSIHDDGSVIWKDCQFDTVHNLHLRLYKPKINAHKLPVLYYFHAGGFCFGKRFYPNAHNSCLSLCSGLHALVISPDYRLAPEHRLPAAIEDGSSALKWMRDQAVIMMSSSTPSSLIESSCERWLTGDAVDFGRVFVFGDSSGGNIVHHLAVRLGTGSLELKPIRIRGFILLSPFFGGTVRTKSEQERPLEDFWSQEIYDQFWRMCIPEGGDADHPLVNPFGPENVKLGGVSLDPLLVIVGGEEIMRDRVKDYAMRMKGFDHEVEYVEFKGKQHGFFTSYSYSVEAKDVIQLVQQFMSRNSNY